jgi:signal transduction histidine kinase
LLRITNRRVAEVPLPWLTNDPASSKGIAISGKYLWLASSGGIMRMSIAELDRAANGDSVRIVPTVFGALDGLSVPRTPSLTPIVMRVGKGGRVWIATPNGLAFVDPADRIVNATPPRVHVEELLVAGSVVPLADGGTIEPNPNRVEIRFTAISTVLPERVRLQYRLDGADDRWIDDGGPRLASYSRPGPGDYRFRVRAWNEDGVPSRGEATLQFRILPAWYQSRVFLALCVVGVAGLGAVGAVGWQRGRTRRATERVQARFEAVLAERTRIARELHDTLLQGFTGITLQLEGLRGSLKERAAQSANELAVILGHADTALREAREMVWDMRSPELQDADLASALEQVTKRVANASHVQVLHLVSGPQRRLPPAVEATILRIGREAVFNALQHGDPTSVTVHLTFEPRHVMLEVSDDGRGADPAQLAAAPARGHWGIAGMRERAQTAGGTFVLATALKQGLKLSVSLPAERIG